MMNDDTKSRRQWIVWCGFLFRSSTGIWREWLWWKQVHQSMNDTWVSISFCGAFLSMRVCEKTTTISCHEIRPSFFCVVVSWGVHNFISTIHHESDCLGQKYNERFDQKTGCNVPWFAFFVFVSRWNLQMLALTVSRRKNFVEETSNINWQLIYVNWHIIMDHENWSLKMIP